MTPTALSALAERVCIDEPSDELRDAVLIAMGWERVKDPEPRGIWWIAPDGFWGECPPNPLTSIDAAAALMPDGRLVAVTEYASGRWVVSAYAFAFGPPIIVGDAPDEPRARTAAALMVMAAMTAEVKA